MRLFGAAVLWLTAVLSVQSLPSFPKELARFRDELFRPVPVVIWHGLGDSAFSPWLAKLKEHLEEMYPGIYVHLVAIKPSLFADQRATVFGNVNDQIDQVHHTLRSIPELRHGFDAVGFSQGGQFLRGYVERYNTPRVRNLITFGSQHMGITDLPACSPYDPICHTLHSVLTGRAYSDYAQSSIVTAQYFRDTRSKHQFTLYQERNKFLRDINNEGQEKNTTYKANLQRLDKFVMVKFSEEATVVPATSAWFAAYEDPNTREGCANATIPLRRSPLYQEDWIGLRALDRKGALAFLECPGGHMHLSPECLTRTFGQYLGRPDLPGSLEQVSSPSCTKIYYYVFFCGLVLVMVMVRQVQIWKSRCSVQLNGEELAEPKGH